MPTARELLEQADALMQRNRGREEEAELDIPELTDEVAVAAVALPARDSSMVARTPPRPRHMHVDEVPELHDAVEKLSIQPLPDHEGEVSRWLEVDLGEVSITGPAPDSIAVVPPSTLRVRPPTPKVDALPIPKVDAPSTPTVDAPSTPNVDAPMTPTLDDASAAAAAERREPLPPAPSQSAAAALVAAKVAGTLSGQPAEPPPASDPAFEAMLGAAPVEIAFEWDPVPPPVVIAPAETAVAVSTELASPVALEPVAVEPAAAPAPPPTPTPVPDAQRWEGLAEDIRMQVLQRIDIFTDTGLHGELAARLQPIVDRASADLVTTINREVGQILRAYVAEAIEREIEKWREANP